MTAADFARIKARFPTLRWRQKPSRVAQAWRGSYCLAVLLHDDGSWSWRFVDDANFGMSKKFPTLGRCLRSLECAILREARTLAGMVGKDVSK